MRKTSTRLPEQGTQTPPPAPDLIPAETENQPRTHIEIGTVNGAHQITTRSRSVRKALWQPETSASARKFMPRLFRNGILLPL
jgi:hypothetical protein